MQYLNVNNDLYFASVAEELREGRSVKLLLKGVSMHPTIHDGDPIVVSPVDSEVVVGDVVLARAEGLWRLHRVVEATGDSLLLRGDNAVSSERCLRSDVVGRLTSVGDIAVGSDRWHRMSRRSLRRRSVLAFGRRWLGRRGRRQLRPWYFAALAVLMWAPLNGLGVPLDNYVLGIRADHLLHASVYLPCVLFLIDPARRRYWLAWLLAVAVGLTTEGVQYLLPYRGFDVNDLIANTIGASLGALAVFCLFKSKNNSYICSRI